jgi:hypothetical protein
MDLVAHDILVKVPMHVRCRPEGKRLPGFRRPFDLNPCHGAHEVMRVVQLVRRHVWEKGLIGIDAPCRQSASTREEQPRVCRTYDRHQERR